MLSRMNLFELTANNIAVYLKVQIAIDKLPPTLQKVVQEMIDTGKKPEITSDEFDMVVSTIADAIWPTDVEVCDEEELEMDAEIKAETIAFGNNLSARMKAVNMTLGTLAHETGLGEDFLGRVIRGEVYPTNKTIKLLANVLGVETAELVSEPVAQEDTTNAM